MTEQAELAVPVFVAMLAGALPTEPSVPVIQSLTALAERLMVQLAEPGWVPQGRRLVADAAAALLRSAEPGSDHQLAWAQLLSWTATSAGQLDLIAGLLDGSAAVAGLDVSVELRWSLLRRLAATGRADDASVDAELARDTTDAGRRNAAACLAAMPDAVHKEAAWQSLTAGDLGMESLRAIADAFMQPEQASLLAPYAERYLPDLEKIWTSGTGHLRVLLADLLFPYPAVSADLLAQLDEFLAAPRDPGLTRVLAERRDTAARALRSRALPH
jgi:aminopeptidase N